MSYEFCICVSFHLSSNYISTPTHPSIYSYNYLFLTLTVKALKSAALDECRCNLQFTCLLCHYPASPPLSLIWIITAHILQKHAFNWKLKVFHLHILTAGTLAKSVFMLLEFLGRPDPWYSISIIFEIMNMVKITFLT